MKTFAHYSLEGLLRQGPHEVWITLGTYDSADQVERAAEDSRSGDEIVATRVLSCYRDDQFAISRDSVHAGQVTVA